MERPLQQYCVLKVYFQISHLGSEDIFPQEQCYKGWCCTNASLRHRVLETWP